MEAWTHPLFLDDKERLFELLTAETLSTLHGDDYDARELYPPGHPHAGEPSLLREGRDRLRTFYEPSTNLLGCRPRARVRPTPATTSPAPPARSPPRPTTPTAAAAARREASWPRPPSRAAAAAAGCSRRRCGSRAPSASGWCPRSSASRSSNGDSGSTPRSRARAPAAFLWERLGTFSAPVRHLPAGVYADRFLERAPDMRHFQELSQPSGGAPAFSEASLRRPGGGACRS